jgi:tetratricopeptide (TPR) repeat protein
MSRKRPSDQHLTSEEASGFIENTLARRRLREIEQHMDECLDCVEYLASVIRAARPPTPEEAEALSRFPTQRPEELLERLRPQIVASSPKAARRPHSPWTWAKWLPPAAAVAGLVLAFAWLQSQVLGPARGRQLAASAMEHFVSLHQGTGRIPLRYVPEFQRARVTRSTFDTAHPAEAAIEAQLRQAVDLAPNEGETRLALGLFLLDKGALDEAEEHIRKARESEPDSALATNGLAVVHYERAIRDPSRARGLLREGLALLREARRKSPDDLQIAFNLAVFYQESGSRAVAKEYWAAYLELDPDSEWAEVAAEKLEDLGGP